MSGPASETTSTTTEVTDTNTPAPSLDEQAHAAFSAGIANASNVVDDGPLPPRPDEEVIDDEPPVVVDDANATPPTAAAPAPAPGEPAAAPAPAPAAEGTPTALDQEIAGLKLKDKAAARFRELSSEIGTSRPVMEELAKVGVKSPEELKAVLQTAATGLQYQELIDKYQVQPEQYGNAMAIIGAMNSGNPELQWRAVMMMHESCVAKANELGRELPGGADPLAVKGNEDLAAQVDSLEITRERALELARYRAIETQRTQRESAERDAGAQTEAMQGAQRDALQGINDFEADMKAMDPHYAHRFEAIKGKLATLAATLPPEKWAAQVRSWYREVAAPVVAPSSQHPARVRVTGTPTRAGGSGGTIASNAGVKAEPTTDYDAFRRGIEEASAR